MAMEFWESSFQDKQAMWGYEPVDCVNEVAKLFLKNELKNILIPGFGYGRNARPFLDKGMNVTGIEISKTAIDLAHAHFKSSIIIFHGSVSQMPFDQQLYDGIFSYALLHLLSKKDREKFIRDCYQQLKPEGLMVFVTISKSDTKYGEGRKLDTDSIHTSHGVNLFFYDLDSIERDFGSFGLIEAREINEPDQQAHAKVLANHL